MSLGRTGMLMVLKIRLKPIFYKELSEFMLTITRITGLRFVPHTPMEFTPLALAA